MANAELPKRRGYRVTPKPRAIAVREVPLPQPIVKPIRGRIRDRSATYPCPLYSVSIAVHDRVDLTAKCIDLVRMYSPPDTQILVFDNASGSETAQLLMFLGGRVSAHRSPDNLGFGEAHRQNLKRADGVYFVVLNNDVEVCEGWLEAMRARFTDDPCVGIAGPKSSACKLNQDGIGSACPPAIADYVEGSCLMMPTWLARQVGLFDPQFHFAYCEDADLSLRVRKRGWRIAFSETQVKHYRCGTADIVRKRGTVDLDAFHRKNHQLLKNRWTDYLQRRTFAQKVLVRRHDAHGDVLLLTPVLRAMKEHHAHADIYVETNVPEVLERNPYVKQAARSFRGQKFDGAYDLNLCYERSPHEHVITAYAKLIGVDVHDWLLDYRPDPADERRLPFWKDRLAVIHPGQSTWPGRAWSILKWKQISRWLADNGWDVAVVGHESLPILDGESIDYRGHSVSASATLIANANLFVGVDSFPMHLAQAALVPTVALFGCITPSLRLLPFPFIRSVTARHVSCLGCHHRRQGPLTHGKCDRPTIECMDELNVEDVKTEIGIALEARKMYLETSKIRDRVLKYCEGKGIDIGCGRDKIRPDALGFDDDVWPEVDIIGDASGPMPFPDGGWDYVYSSHALEDIADTRATLREWVRILRIGGHIVLHVPNPDHYKGFNAEHVHAGWRPHELSQLVQDAGCDIAEAFEDVGNNRYSTVVVGRRRA